MRRIQRRRGHALVIALVVLVLVGAAAGAVAVSLQLEMRTAQQESRRIHLVALSDAAMAEALAELARTRLYTGGAERRFGKGTIGSEVRFLGNDRYQIEVSATISGWERRVEAEVLRAGSSPPVVLTWRILS